MERPAKRPLDAASVSEGPEGTAAPGGAVAHDQPDNALRARKLGISNTIARGQYSAKRVARRLRRLLDNGTVAARAQEVAKVVGQENGAAAAADAVARTFSGSGDRALFRA
jgi:UDP:flavonoid glycosyltransferase YjiC (YdhE family)